MFSGRLLVSSSVLCLCMAVPAWASADTPPAAVALAPQTTADGVLVFVPDFFAHYRPNTALDMVSRVPGFSVDDGDGTRGFEGSVGNVLINGSRPASKSDTGSSVLSRTGAAQVERIELIRGGAPGIEMQGYATVVNVIIKDTARTEHVLTHSSYIYDGGRSLFGGSYQLTHRKGEHTLGLFLSDGISSSDSVGEGPYRRFGPDGALLQDEHYNSTAAGGGTSVRGTYTGPVRGGKLDLTARYGVNDWTSTAEETSAQGRRDNLFVEDVRSAEVGVTYSRDISTRTRSETRLIHQFDQAEATDRSSSERDGVASPEQLFFADSDSSETILRSLIRHQRSDALEIEAGAEVAYNVLDTRQSYSVGGTNVPLPSATLKVEELRGELFGKGTWRINPQWTLEAGLRLEHSTLRQSGDAGHEDSFFFAKPRALLSWTPRESSQLRLLFERSVGQLNFGDFAASTELATGDVMGGNVNLTPEQRWTSEISYEQRFWKEGIISVAYRHDAISDAIDVIPLEGGLAAVGNIGDGTLDQLRVSLALPTDALRIPGGKLTFKNSWNKTEVTDPTSGRTRPISGIRPTQAQISFEQNITALNLGWGVDWLPRMSEYRYQPDAVSGWDGKDYYVVWADYKPVPTLSIRAQVSVWDSFYWQREAYGDRDTRPVAFTEVRDVAPRPFYQLRVRKTF